MIESGGERGRRALTWIALASVGLLAAAIVYLRPSLTSPAVKPVPGATASQHPGTPVFFTVSFGDARHGAVQAFSQGSHPPPIYLTSDGGRTWRPLAERTVPIAAVTYVDGRRMLAEEFRSGFPRLLVSDDGGRTWRLAVDPRQSIIGGSCPMFLGSYGWWLDWQPQPAPSLEQSTPFRLWRTLDGGRIWAPATPSGIPPFDSIDQVRFMDQRRGLLAMISGGDQGRAVVVATHDGGDTWQTAATFDSPLAGMHALGILLLQHGTRLVAWSAFSAPDLRTGSPLPLESATVSTFASVSDDGGATWGPLRTGPVTTVPYGAAALVDDKGRLLLLEGRQLWISDDDGASWVARVAVVPPGMVPVFMSAVVPGSIYVVAVRSSGAVRVGNQPAALLRSSDGGIHWTEVHLPG